MLLLITNSSPVSDNFFVLSVSLPEARFPPQDYNCLRSGLIDRDCSPVLPFDSIIHYNGRLLQQTQSDQNVGVTKITRDPTSTESG